MSALHTYDVRIVLTGKVKAETQLAAIQMLESLIRYEDRLAQEGS